MWSGQMIDALHRALGGTKHERTKFSFTDGLRDLPERKERSATLKSAGVLHFASMSAFGQ
jgi:hypothetical protein